MARTAQNARKSKANKNCTPLENNTTAEQILSKQEKHRKRTQQKQKKADKLLIVYSVEQTQDKWIFRLFNKNKQAYKLLITEKNSMCSCTEKSNETGACRHFQFIFVNVVKCQLAFQQLQQKRIISQSTFYSFEKKMKQIISSRLIPSKLTEIKQELCYICMLQKTQQQGPSIKECCSCSKKFHTVCTRLWKSLGQRDCPLCHKALQKETKQASDDFQLGQCDN